MMATISFSERLVGFLPNMRRFSISLTGSADSADDLVQSACERALAHQQSFDPLTRFDAWIFRIIRNLWIDQVRRQKTAGPRAEISDYQDVLGTGGEGEAVARMELAEVISALATLSNDQREVLVLVCVEDFSYRDAAALLDLPVGTVMSRLARARRNLAVASGIIGKDERSSEEKG
jgi:RNA polymerase sigma-70 factor, ECF subfamily